jgi:hypothetical protein
MGIPLAKGFVLNLSSTQTRSPKSPSAVHAHPDPVLLQETGEGLADDCAPLYQNSIDVSDIKF